MCAEGGGKHGGVLCVGVRGCTFFYGMCEVCGGVRVEYVRRVGLVYILGRVCSYVYCVVHTRVWMCMECPVGVMFGVSGCVGGCGLVMCLTL